MSRLSQIGKILALIAVLSVIIFAVFGFALFHGYFDHGTSEVERVEHSSQGQLAMIASRSDNEALSGPQYFVVTGEHLYSSRELRHAYYYDKVIFRAGSDCLNVKWADSNHLTISCNNSSITQDSIAVEKKKYDGIVVSYANIPNKD